jgi:hypothetical protein
MPQRKPHSRIAALLLGAALATAARAQFPVQDMDGRTLGLAYTFGLRGQDITDAAVASHEVLHQASLAYAPLPYVALKAGIGMERFSVEPYNQTRFRGGYGASPAFGIDLYSPFFAAETMRGTAGAHLLFMGSEDGRGYRYSATVASPFLGLIVSPTVFLDVTVGGRMHLMNGSMKSPRDEAGAGFANTEIARGYLALNLKTPFERAFLNVDFDFSPMVDMDWSNGPREAAVAVSFGTLLGWKGKSQPKGASGAPAYFPAYDEMKRKQEKMAEEIE